MIVIVLLRNKPICRAGTTPMGFLDDVLVGRAMMSDLSSVMATGRRLHKENPEADCRKS